MVDKTSLVLVDWASIAVSFFNTIALLWLGLMVLLNTENRRWGTWIGSGSMLLGGVFFLAHTLVIGQAMPTFSSEMEFWWRIGWIPFVSAPYLWYVLIAWYTGIVRIRRHRLFLAITSALGTIALSLLVFRNPLPSYSDIISRSSEDIFTVAGIPAVILIYPVFSALCIVLSLSALIRPLESDRFMGNLARKRARPWLIAASVVLLIVSLIIGGTVAWMLHKAYAEHATAMTWDDFTIILLFDLIICSLIAVVVVFLGMAVVSYEVFTGKALPRGGLRRYWRSSLLFAASYGMLVAWFLEYEIQPIYILLFITVIVTLRFALFNWRAYVERERNIEQLRPFVASQRLYDRMMTTAKAADVDIVVPLRTLCEDVLGARLAYLAALGPLIPLVGPVVSYVGNGAALQSLSSQALAELSKRCDSPTTMYVPLDPTHYGGAVWAVPLWSERGLIGVLLLGSKVDDGLYTQEEIEIARATGERLIDMQASTELAHRLIALQRQQMVASQVIDQRTRRELHDDILPQLHMAMLLLSGTPQTEATGQVIESLTQTHRQISNLLHAMPSTSTPEIARLGLVRALRQQVDKELGKAFDKVHWDVSPEAETSAPTLSQLTSEVIFYAAREVIRNAARYGRGKESKRQLNLRVWIAWRDGLEIIIEDDGVGIDTQHDDWNRCDETSDEQLSGKGGCGQGLALHTTMMTVIGGTLTIDSVKGSYTRVILAVGGD